MSDDEHADEYADERDDAPVDGHDDELPDFDGIDLVSQRNDLAAELRVALSECLEAGREHASLSNEFRRARGLATAQLREAGTPVTIIDKLLYNDPDVALLRLKCDMAEVEYKVAFEAVNVVKLLLRSAEEDVKRDWSTQQ